VLKEQPTLQIQGLGALRQAQGGLSDQSKAGAKTKQDVQPVTHKDVV
jgi:hypothetical protein